MTKLELLRAILDYSYKEAHNQRDLEAFIEGLYSSELSYTEIDLDLKILK